MSVIKFNESIAQNVRHGMDRRLIYTDHLMTVIVDFNDGPWPEAEPYHSHPNEQTCYVAEGEIIFMCEDEPEQHLKAGDLFAVPSGKNHTIRLLTAKARLIDSFTPIRDEFI